MRFQTWQKQPGKMLADQEINIPDELLGHLVSEDAGQTKTSVEAFVRLYKGAVQEAVKNALKGNPPESWNWRKVHHHEGADRKDQGSD